MGIYFCTTYFLKTLLFCKKYLENISLKDGSVQARFELRGPPRMLQRAPVGPGATLWTPDINIIHILMSNLVKPPESVQMKLKGSC